MDSGVIQLLDWYQKNKRLLPWRKDKEPYHVWISEVMLQQTRIEAVIPYYERFMQRVPDILSLAQIKEEELLKLWEGLGYYSRARNLKRAAQIVVEDYDGVFPNTYEEIIKLPGIGEYTASAIASICFQEKVATVDGNVLRVFARVNELAWNINLASTKKLVQKQLLEIMPLDAGKFNEALMELGEVVCLPSGKPKCMNCPLKDECKAYAHQTWEQFPIKDRPKPKKELFYTIFLFQYQGEVAILQRVNEKMLHRLWEFPNILDKFGVQEMKDWLHQQHIAFVKIKKASSHKHVFTHQIWYMQSYIIEVKEKINAFVWVTLEDLEGNYAIPTAFKPFLKDIKKMTYSRK